MGLWSNRAKRGSVGSLGGLSSVIQLLWTLREFLPRVLCEGFVDSSHLYPDPRIGSLIITSLDVVETPPESD